MYFLPAAESWIVGLHVGEAPYFLVAKDKAQAPYQLTTVWNQWFPADSKSNGFRPQPGIECKCVHEKAKTTGVPTPITPMPTPYPATLTPAPTPMATMMTHPAWSSFSHQEVNGVVSHIYSPWEDNSTIHKIVPTATPTPHPTSAPTPPTRSPTAKPTPTLAPVPQHPQMKAHPAWGTHGSALSHWGAAEEQDQDQPDYNRNSTAAQTIATHKHTQRVAPRRTSRTPRITNTPTAFPTPVHKTRQVLVELEVAGFSRAAITSKSEGICTAVAESLGLVGQQVTIFGIKEIRSQPPVILRLILRMLLTARKSSVDADVSALTSSTFSPILTEAMSSDGFDTSRGSIKVVGANSTVYMPPATTIAPSPGQVATAQQQAQLVSKHSGLGQNEFAQISRQNEKWHRAAKKTGLQKVAVLAPIVMIGALCIWLFAGSAGGWCSNHSSTAAVNEELTPVLRHAGAARLRERGTDITSDADI
jgi:hypothetical protein